MTIKYALLNPATGQYDFFNTEEEIKKELAIRALAFYQSHGHGIAYSKVSVDENGWETWDSVNHIYVQDASTEALKEIQALL